MLLSAGTIAAGICFWPAARSKCAPLRISLAAILTALAIAFVSSLLPASLRTGLLPIAALLLARFRLPQLAYAAMLVGAYRLLTFDLHAGPTPALVLTLLVYGAALMLVGRVFRR
jgi:hypothetical protein